MGSVERGERNLSLRNIWKIAEALDVRPSALLANTEASMTAPDEAARVCPRCGTPAEGNAFCAGCGLNLRQQGELPTADAYAAQQREKTWLARQGEQERRLEAAQSKATEGQEHAGRQTTGAIVQPEPTENEVQASRARKRRSLLVAAAAITVLVAGGIAVAALALGDDDPMTEDQVSSATADPSTSSPTSTDQDAVSDAPSEGDDSDPSTPTDSTPDQGAIEAAEAVLAEEGYEPMNFDFYDPEALMQVVVGVNSAGGGACPGELAFFFIRNDYIGTDTSDPSCNVEIENVEGNTATLTYAIFEQGDPLCCPSGGETEVRYEWIESSETLNPLDPIPPQSGPDSGGR